MKKIPDNLKPLIILLASLCAFSAIYFYSEKRHEKARVIEAAQEPQEIAEQEQDVAAEIWAKKEFLRREMTYGMDEDDEEDEDANLYKEDFAYDEMMRDTEEEDFHDETPLIQENSSADESKALEEDKETVAEEKENSAIPDKERAQETTSVAEQHSPFSAKAQVLSVFISNDAQNESEFDPYEDIVTPDKIAISPEEEPAKIHQSEATAQIAPSTKEITVQPEVADTTQAEKEAQQIAEQESRSKAYVEVTSGVSYLMTKFLQKTDYTKELNSIDQTKFPLEVKQVLAEMKDFAENDMKAPASSGTKIFPKEGVLDSIVGHFVQIEKVTDSKHRDEKYEQIRRKLHILEDYFYSQKFLKEMMGN